MAALEHDCTRSDAGVKHLDVKLPAAETVAAVSDFFKVFGDPTRVNILWALDRREMCVCDIAGALDMSKSAVSHQLAVLRAAALVKFRREGKAVFYSLADEHVCSILECGTEHVNERIGERK